MRGKLPFPNWILVTPIKVYQTELSEDGEPIEELIFDGLCSFDEKSKQTLDKERRLVTLSGKAIIKGDINPEKLIEGYILLGEIQRSIFRAAKPRNPDGSVFSTELELM
ncbi:hypothetical protein J2Z69_000772 [Paenibacillus shirakamiensis]|uniref:Single-stranded DNA-binding protein n=1 Tax=Paenibacillus shirakamiensis TaxID=1265935 RepID=A0ABS4JDI3_9BACL|nr:hypothetical protein [Paenibacillus shirakamiensis]MBP1999753.1 hypothetical protein [Paenibacillus shirakamiensis]